MSSYFLDDLREELRTAATRQAAGGRVRRVRIPGRSAVAAAALTLATAAALFVGVRAVSGPGVDETPATSAKPPAAASIDPDVAKDFALLRRSPTSADAIPQRWQHQLPRLAGADGAPAPSIPPDFDAARRASPDVSVWVVPGDGGVCLFEVLGNGTGFDCGSTEDAVRGQVFGISAGAGLGLSAGERRVSGLLPDGVSDVSLRMRDGTTQAVVVQGNVYAVDVSGAPAELTWTDARGTAGKISLASGGL